MTIYMKQKGAEIYGDKATAQYIMHFPDKGTNVNEDKANVMYREQQWKNYAEPDHQGSNQN